MLTNKSIFRMTEVELKAYRLELNIVLDNVAYPESEVYAKELSQVNGLIREFVYDARRHEMDDE